MQDGPRWSGAARGGVSACGRRRRACADTLPAGAALVKRARQAATGDGGLRRGAAARARCARARGRRGSTAQSHRRPRRARAHPARARTGYTDESATAGAAFLPPNVPPLVPNLLPPLVPFLEPPKVIFAATREVIIVVAMAAEDGGEGRGRCAVHAVWPARTRARGAYPRRHAVAVARAAPTESLHGIHLNMSGFHRVLRFDLTRRGAPRMPRPRRARARAPHRSRRDRDRAGAKRAGISPRRRAKPRKRISNGGGSARSAHCVSVRPRAPPPRDAARRNRVYKHDSLTRMLSALVRRPQSLFYGQDAQP